MIRESYDVIVVGAGPAGSQAARFSALKGAKTLLLDRDPIVGTPVRCGEAISLSVVERFIPVQERWIARRVFGAVLVAPNGKEVTIESKSAPALILERNLFDRYLGELAADAGSDVLTRANVDGLLKDGNRVAGVTFERFGKRYNVSAKVVIGADGVESRVGRWAGFKTQLRAADLESAYQMYLSGIDYDERYGYLYFGGEMAPGGYVWIFPKAERMASVGIGVCVSDSEPGLAYRLLQEFIKKRFGNAAIVGEMAGAVPVAKPLKEPYKDGIILAGDAARHCNPLTGGGIATAMIAGFHAGETAAEVALAGDASARALKAYDDRLEDEITKPNLRSFRLKEGVNKLSDDVLNRTADELLTLPEGERTLKNAFIHGLKTQPMLLVDILKAFL